MFIFSMSILFVGIAIISMIRRKYSKATLFLLFMGLSYLIVISSIIIYLSKDAYYYNSLYQYFGIVRSLQNQLMFLPISRYTLIRMLNISSMAFLYFGLTSAIFFTFRLKPVWERRILFMVALPTALQVVIYDPSFYKWLYYQLYPELTGPQSIKTAYNIIHIFTFTCNSSYIAAGIGLFIYTFLHTPKVRQIRSSILMILICYASVQVTYYYINSWAPDILVIVSKAADFIRFKPINLSGNPFMYTLLPDIAILCLTISLYGIYKYARIQKSIKNHEMVISRNIDSAALTTRVFSHYMKNELLAILAQTEFLEQLCEESPNVVEEIKVIEQRCKRIYERLDEVHHNTLKNKLELKPIRLNKLTEKLLNEMLSQLKYINVNFTPSPVEPMILADPYYFSQAVENIVSNAIDALDRVPEKERRIEISIMIRNKWVEMSITDNGSGIADENLEHIFQPFFSTKPTSKSWGMGLSLCHNIITSQDGKLTVTSREGEGASFHIVMPLIDANI